MKQQLVDFSDSVSLDEDSSGKEKENGKGRGGNVDEEVPGRNWKRETPSLVAGNEC